MTEDKAARRLKEILAAVKLLAAEY